MCQALEARSVWAWQGVLTPAAVSCGISIEARLALGTAGPCRVVEAAQALPRAPVARLRVRHIDVIVALAGQAAPALSRVPVVARGTLVTAGTCWHRALGRARGHGSPGGTECAVPGTHLCTQGCSGKPPAGSGCLGSRRQQSGGGCWAPQGRGRAGSAARSPALGSRSARPRTCGQELSGDRGCWQRPAPVWACAPPTSGTSPHPCGHGSAGSCLSEGHSSRRARCTGRAGRQGSPSGRAGSGHSVGHGCPHGRDTALWCCRRWCSLNPRGCTGTLESSTPSCREHPFPRPPALGCPGSSPTDTHVGTRRAQSRRFPENSGDSAVP